MRTTIRLDDALFAAVKRYGAETGQTFTAIVEASLRRTLARRHEPKARKRIRLKTVGGRGTRPGIGIDDTTSLIEIMEERG